LSTSKMFGTEYRLWSPLLYALFCTLFVLFPFLQQDVNHLAPVAETCRLFKPGYRLGWGLVILLETWVIWAAIQ
jgi:hypothetical protein